MIDKVIASCKRLSPIPGEAALAYAQAADLLLAQVNQSLESRPDIKELIGRNPLELMWDNHRNHAAFMSTVFGTNSFELLARTVPWVYRAYRARGFSSDYFPAALSAWQGAVDHCLGRTAPTKEITDVYTWMIQHHDEMIELSISGEGLSLSPQREPDGMQQIFLSLLLHGDRQGCLTLVNQSIHSVEDLKHFYLDVVMPALYRIGLLWESNQISVAVEHLATALVGRVMAALYPRFAQFTVTHGKALVTAGPNEFHEVGARMVADFLELDGWDVTYLGANIPAAEILEFLQKQRPFLVALSVATVMNIENARQMIRLIKADPETRGIKIMTGGLAFNEIPDLWRELGADGYAAGADSATRLSHEWWMARNS